MNAKTLQKLFKGQTRYHGRHTDRGHACVKEPISEGLFGRHIAGEYDLGVYPLLDNGTCYFGAIDVDEENAVGRGQAIAIGRDQGISFATAKSRRKGHHLYCFFKEPVSAASLRRALVEISRKSNLTRVDIFPRQEKLLGSSFGNYISLPCFGNGRGFLDGEPNAEGPFSDGSRLGLFAAHLGGREAVAVAVRPLPKVTEKSDVKKPCLLKEIDKGTGDGFRNTTGLRIASEFDSGSRVSVLSEWNSRNVPQLAERELQSLYAGGDKYSFGCRDEVLKRLCLFVGREIECPAYRAFVTSRKFGTSGGSMAEFSEGVADAKKTYSRILKRPSALKSFVDANTKCSEAPSIFWEFAILAAGGALLTPTTHIFLGEERVNTNMWVMLVAPSSKFHKSTVCKRAKDAASAVTNGGITISGDFTTEGLLSHLATRKRVLIYFDEFARFLSEMHTKAYMAGTDAILTELYDHHPIYTVTRKLSGTTVIREPAVSVLGATTLDTFLGHSRPEEWAGGFLARFVIIPASDGDIDKQLDFPPSLSASERLGLVSALQEASAKAPSEMSISDDAKIMYSSWRRNHLRSYSDIPTFGGTYSRLTVVALKIAAILTAYESPGRTVIETPAMADAIEFASIAAERFNNLTSSKVSFDNKSALRRRIMEILNGAGGPVLKRDMLRQLDVDVSAADASIRTLEAQGLAKTGTLPFNGDSLWVVWSTASVRMLGTEAKAVS